MANGLRIFFILNGQTNQTFLVMPALAATVTW